MSTTINNSNNSRSEELIQIAAAVGLSLGISQVAGSIVILTQIIAGIANIIKVGGLAKQVFFLSLNERQFKHLPTDSEKLLNYKNHLEGTKVELRNSKRDIKRNMHRIAASILCLCPVVGLIAASAYLSATDKVISNGSKVEMRTAAMAKLLVMGGPLGGLASKLAPKAIYPISGRELDSWQASNDFVSATIAKEIKIRVERGDGKKHEICCHYSNTAEDSTAKTMVLFHGNGMIGSHMANRAEEYIEKGWNVLMVTMGGYPGSDPGVETNEATTIQDVNSVIQHLKKLGVTEIGVHGYSIGGTLAAHAMKLEPELINFGVLERTLNNGPGVVANMLTNVIAKNIGQSFPKLEKLLLKIPHAVVWGIAEGALNTGREVPGVPGYFTDGLDNMEKVKGFKHNLVAIGGEEDDLMGIKSKDEDLSKIKFDSEVYFKGMSPDLYERTIRLKYNKPKYPRNFSHELSEAHQSAQPDVKSFHHLIDEGHVGELDARTWQLIENARPNKQQFAACG